MKIILFACLLWHPFLLQSGFFLSPYPSWHAPSDSNSTCLFCVVSYPNRTPPQKSLTRNLQNRFFPSPHHQTMPSESLTPRPHHALYWLGTGWWCLGLTHAFFPYVSKICLLPIRLPWSGGLPVLPTVCFLWPFMWLLLDFLLLSRTGLYLMMDLIFHWPTSFPAIFVLLFLL